MIETIFCRITAGVWMSRSSVVYGPFSIVWGLGAVLLTAVLYKYRHKSDSYVFLVGTVVGGRINLLYCFFWGIAAVVWLKSIYPRLSQWIERLPLRIGRVLSWVLILFMVVNIAVSCLAMGRYTQRQTMDAPPDTALGQLLDRRFPDSRMERIYPNAILVD